VIVLSVVGNAVELLLYVGRKTFAKGSALRKGREGGRKKDQKKKKKILFSKGVVGTNLITTPPSAREKRELDLHPIKSPARDRQERDRAFSERGRRRGKNLLLLGKKQKNNVGRNGSFEGMTALLPAKTPRERRKKREERSRVYRVKEKKKDKKVTPFVSNTTDRKKICLGSV